MLGIVTALTYKLDEMSYARFWPQHVDGGLGSILPPAGSPVPDATIESMMQYYSEFIQYPTHHNASGVLFKNTWDNLGRAEDAITLIDHTEDDFQRDYVFLEDVAVRGFKTVQENFPTDEYLQWIFGYLVSFTVLVALLTLVLKVGAFSEVAMKNFEEPVTTTVTEAMHFQRGLHYLSVSRQGS